MNKKFSSSKKSIDDTKVSLDVGDGDDQSLELLVDRACKDLIDLQGVRHSKDVVVVAVVLVVGVVACTWAASASVGR